MTETNPRSAIEHQAFAAEIIWKKSNEGLFPYSATLDDVKFLIRVNDFPADPYVYTLFVDGKLCCDFNGWPKTWVRVREYSN